MFLLKSKHNFLLLKLWRIYPLIDFNRKQTTFVFMSYAYSIKCNDKRNSKQNYLRSKQNNN